MEKVKLKPGVILCLILAGSGLAFFFTQKFSHSVAITKPLVIVQDNVAGAKLTPTQPDLKSSRSVLVPVLMYHHIGYVEEIYTKPNALDRDLTVSPKDFEDQVNYFKDAGYQTISVKQVYDALQNGESLPSKPIVFTFDDGYSDALANAPKILEKYGYTGSFAIATELIGRPSYASWDDVIAAKNSGMEILSHTENHLDLTNPIYSDADLHREIVDSKTILEQKLNSPVDFFVYPYGSHNQKVEAMVQAAGYKMAFTVAYGQNISADHYMTEPRVRVHGEDGLSKLKKIFSGVSRNASAGTNL